MRAKIVLMNNVCRHNEQLSAVVAPSPADNNKSCSTVGVPENARRVQLLEKIAVVNQTKSKKMEQQQIFPGGKRSRSGGACHD